MLAAICVVGQQLARLVLAGGVADPRRAAAHQHDGPVAVLLQQAQDHDPTRLPTCRLSAVQSKPI